MVADPRWALSGAYRLRSRVFTVAVHDHSNGVFHDFCLWPANAVLLYALEMARSKDGVLPPERRVVGACIRGIRLERGLTLHALAARAMMSATGVAAVEAGTCDCSLDALFRIARGLQMRPSDIIRSIQETL